MKLSNGKTQGQNFNHWTITVPTAANLHVKDQTVISFLGWDVNLQPYDQQTKV